MAAALVLQGAVAPSDFDALSADEAQEVWPALGDLNVNIVKRFLGFCAAAARREPVGSRAPLAKCPKAAFQPKVPPSPPPAARPSSVVGPAEAAGAALAMVAEAKRVRQPPPPAVLAAAIRTLSKQSVCPGQGAAVGTPAEELARVRSQRPPAELFAQQACWLEFQGWRRSAGAYASAVQLWGHAACLTQQQPWPPGELTLQCFATLFRNGASLGKYLSHLRSVIGWLQSSAGVLSDTSRLVRGAEKATDPKVRRKKVRASVKDTRLLCEWAADNGRGEVSMSWAVARHFTLRYSEVLVIGTDSAPVRLVSTKGKAAVAITFMRRKCYKEPVEVRRQCVCAVLGSSLCGVCALVKLNAQTQPPFLHVTYAESLALLKLGAAAKGLSDPSAWGTHAFRRGWASDALKAGGPTALFYSGGWKGLTAFGYASARARGGLEAADWLVDYSSSSDGE